MRGGCRVVGLATFTLIVWSATGAAFAHIEASPSEATAGSRITVTFTVEHPCSSSQPTTAIEVAPPTGSSAAAPLEKPGFVASAEGDRVRWTGGAAGAHDERFAFDVTLPSGPEVVLFKTIQTCGDTVVRWINEPNADGSEANDDPAPSIRLTGAGPAPTVAETTTLVLTTSTSVAALDDDSEDSSGPVVPIVLALAVVVLAAWASLAFRGGRSRGA